MKTVITGDLIDSTNYTPQELDAILNVVNTEFEYFRKVYDADFKIFRGDSFQGVVLDSSIALDLVLTLKTAVNKIPTKGKKISGLTDFRIAIGIGNINLKRESILESNGEAFQFSGRTLDTMKGDYPRLLLKTADENLNDEFNVHFALLDSVTSKWSVASAEVAYYLLKGKKETEVAEILGINQSAVNHRKKAANWDAVAMLLERYKEAISNYIINKN
ncbi:SatD family protein [Aureibaculum sp. 2210JD6-5]|uniref:SatD family protein n=1 Tax=Aureibaculum sp. 2210JD6-5 TaxID=3103957 RepID=UPI002AAEB9E5|nr:SatD family protein [Aureibaculum sp. 2210JD6-5]MDY7395035.1 SatD family protein [Aureibaculum sp. 2210JD6-5]